MEPHPKIPVLATSGLDHDVKIWVPSCEEEPCLDGLERVRIIVSYFNILSNAGKFM